MKAWVLHGIDDIRYEEVAEPKPAEHEAVVSIKAAGICGSDIPRIYENGTHQMPLIPGHEFSGKVVRTGKKVDECWKGKRVGIFPLIPCRECPLCLKGQYEMCRQYSYLGSRRDGSFAEYVTVPEWNLIELPEQVSYEAAAMLEPMAVAVHAMKRVELLQTDRVVVIGLGTIGLLLTMFLQEQEIQNLFVVGNKDFQEQKVRKLGIPKNHYCDSRAENVKDFVMYHTENSGADVIFECVGRNDTAALAIDLAAPSGEVCLVGNPYTDMNLKKDVYWKILRHQLRVTGTWNSSYTGSDEKNLGADDWQYVLRRLEQRKLIPEEVITHRFAMKDLKQGLQIMHEKKEDYIKVMMVNK